MRFVYYIQFRSCDIKNSEEKGKLDRLEKELDKLYNDSILKDDKKRKEIESICNFGKPDKKLTVDLLRGMIENHIKSEKTNKEVIKEFFVEWSEYLKEPKKYEKYDYYSLKWVCDALGVLRGCVPMPIFVQTRTSIGHWHALISKDESNGPKRPDEGVLMHFQMQTRPGADITEFDGATLEKDEQKLHISLGRACYRSWDGRFKKEDDNSRDETSKKIDLTKKDSEESNSKWEDLKWKLHELIDIYHNKPFQTKNEKEVNTIQHTSGYFMMRKEDIKKVDKYIKVKKDNEENIANLKIELFEEDTWIANQWMKKRYDIGGVKFKEYRGLSEDEEINRKAIAFLESFPFLDTFIDELDRLHLLGCQRFFNTLNWYEFKDAARFFVGFFVKFNETYELLRDSDDAEKYLYVYMLVEDLKKPLRDLNELLNDRLVPDMIMCENVRHSRYSTGAYEMILKCYSNWLKHLRGILLDVEASHSNTEIISPTRSRSADLPFLLVPGGDSIHAHPLFRLCASFNMPVLFHVNMDKMLEINDCLALFAHEIGHYAGLIGKRHGVDTYFHMVSGTFAHQTALRLCTLHFVKTAPETAKYFISKLGKSLYEYIKEYAKEIENRKDHVRKKGLTEPDIAEILVEDIFEKIAQKEIFKNWKRGSDISALSTCEQAEVRLADAFIDLYDILGVASLISTEGHVFFGLLNNVKDEARKCKRLLSECYADMIMIRVLEMTTEEFMSTCIKAEVELNDTAANILNTHNIKNTNKDRFISTRLVCGLLQTEFDMLDIKELKDIGPTTNEEEKKKEEKLNAQTELLKKIMLIKIEKTKEKMLVEFETMEKDILDKSKTENEKAKKEQILKKMQELWSECYKSAQEIANGTDAVEAEWQIMWLRSAMYLLTAGSFIKKHLDKENNYVKKLRIKYRSIVSEENSMEQLARFLTREEDI
jgi:hypothetical protein